jgi:hypothetical protein
MNFFEYFYTFFHVTYRISRYVFQSYFIQPHPVLHLLLSLARRWKDMDCDSMILEEGDLVLEDVEPVATGLLRYAVLYYAVLN